MYHQRSKRRDQVAFRDNLSPSCLGRTTNGLSDPALNCQPLSRQFVDHRFVQPKLPSKFYPVAGGTDRSAKSGLIGTNTLELRTTGKTFVSVGTTRLTYRAVCRGPWQRLDTETLTHFTLCFARGGCVIPTHQHQLFLFRYNLSSL